MTKHEFDLMVAESNEQAKKNYNRAILTQTKNVYKVIFKGKSDSRKTLEIYTTATSCKKAVKKVLDRLFENREKYQYVFQNYVVYKDGFTKTQAFKKLTEAQKRFLGEKHPAAQLVTGGDILFIA